MQFVFGPVLWSYYIGSSNLTAMTTPAGCSRHAKAPVALLRLLSCGSTLSALHQYLQDFWGLDEELAALPA